MKIKIKVMVDHPQRGYLEVPQDHENPLFDHIKQVDAIIGVLKPGCFGVPDGGGIQRVTVGCEWTDDPYVMVFVTWHPDYVKCFPPSVFAKEEPAEPQRVQIQETEAIEPQVPIEEIPY